MTGIIIGYLFLVLHLICCVLVYLAVKYRGLKIKKIIMPLVLFVPFYGIICALLLNVEELIGGNSKKEIGVEKMKINEEVYKSILINNGINDKEVVPLEEALIVNSPAQRRELIMDILYGNPAEYIDLLYQARMNEDVEVVHYATTAMVELSKEYDLKLQRLESEYRKHPDNEALLAEFCEFLKEYITKKLAQGQALIMKRRQYEALLEVKTKKTSHLNDWIDMAENLLELKEYGQAGEVIHKMEEKWPNAESVWILKLKYYATQSQGEKIQQLIQQMQDKHIYLSGKGKEIFDFWKPR